MVEVLKILITQQKNGALQMFYIAVLKKYEALSNTNINYKIASKRVLIEGEGESEAPPLKRSRTLP